MTHSIASQQTLTRHDEPVPPAKDSPECACEATIADLKAALVSAAVINQAVGVLMAQSDCDADSAFSMLAQASQRTNRKVRVVAESIVARYARPPHGPEWFDG
ncbi:ANTAR domain-containing protein [Allonocardiopsis opalescens]|uniref:ANTAR domain-containing protein n=1 Tax=Allonocardiopsis opalescens TaxID=1144618 RepID=UPI00147547B2|nr:ANTAR domain-containing protein [Allonocardiopsis opalescens]